MKTRNLAIAVLISIGLLSGILVSKHFKQDVPAVSAANLPSNLPTPTPYATALPGISVQALQKYARSEILTASVNGLEISVANFRIEKNEVLVDACFQAPSGDGWTPGTATLRIGDVEIPLYGGKAIELTYDLPNGNKRIETFPHTLTGVTEQSSMEIEPDGLPNYSCYTYRFRTETELKPGPVVLTINSMHTSAPEGEGCGIYLQNMQSILDEDNTGIRLDCVKQKGGDVTSIAEKPDSMSDEEATRLVGEASRRVTTIDGPWIFDGKID
jgi:hypothetical protein